MSIFSETITKAISDYRGLLRKQLNQVERMMKLQQLNLKNPEIYKSDVGLYQIASNIVMDIETTMANKPKGYYSYSGIDQFCQYLKEYLQDYEVDGQQVVHRARRASKAMLEAIQLMSLSKDRLDAAISERLFACNQVVADFGSLEQWKVYEQALSQQQVTNPEFYTKMRMHFESVSVSKNLARAEAV